MVVRPRLKALWIAVAAALVILSASSMIASSAVPFGPNVRVSGDATTSSERRPASVADASGNVYAAWAQVRNNDTDLYFGASTDGGGTWSTPIRVGGNPPSGSTQDRPSLALGPKGEILVAWQDDRTTYFDFDIYASVSFDRGASFSSPTKVSDGPPGSLQLVPKVAVGTTGRVVVAWQDFRDGKGEVRASTTTLASFRFGPSVRVDDDQGPGTSAAPSVAVSASGMIYVAYHDNRSGSADVYVAKSSDDGLSFGPSVRVDDTGTSGTPQGLIAIAVDGLGRVYAAWQDGRAGEVDASGNPIYDIYFAKSTDGGRTFTRNVHVDDGPKKTTQETAQIAVGAAGTVYIVWDDGRNIDWDPYFSYSTDGGTTFSPGVRVDDAGGSETDPILQYNPQIVESNTGLVTAIWEDDRGPTWDIYGSTARLPLGSALAVRVDLGADTAWPGDSVPLTVRVTSNGTPADGASVTFSSTASGAFGALQWIAPGTYQSSFESSPNTPDGTDVVLTATAQKAGYINGASQATLHVRKSIVATLDPTWDTLVVGQTMEIKATATAHGGPLANATAQSDADGGTVDPGTGLTDTQGRWSAWFTPASGSGGTDVTISVALTKSGYHPGSAQVVVQILAQPLPMDVTMTSKTREMMSRERATIRVELTGAAGGVTKAILSPFCLRGGTFSPVTELGAGVYAFTWDAPDVTSSTWASLGVRAQRGGYADVSGRLAVLVDPNMSVPANPTQLFVVAIAEATSVHGGHSIAMTLYVYTTQGYTVSGATVHVSVSGNFGTATAPADQLNGMYTFVYTAPSVASNVGIFLRIDASKYGYTVGTTRIALMILP